VQLSKGIHVKGRYFHHLVSLVISAIDCDIGSPTCVSLMHYYTNIVTGVEVIIESY